MAYRDRRVVAIVQARMGSSRLPGKVMRPLAGRTVLAHVLDRVEAMELVDEVVVATSEAGADDRLAAWLQERRGVMVVRGDEEDVLERYYQAVMEVGVGAEVVVRITGDSPLVCIPWVQRGVKMLVDRQVEGVDLSTEATGMTRGFGAGVYTARAVIDAHLLARKAEEREHVTLFIKRHRSAFEVIAPPASAELRTGYRLTLDYEEDYQVLRRLYEALYRRGKPIDCREAVRWLEAHPQVAGLNAHRGQRRVGKEDEDHPKLRPPPFWSARW